MRRVSSARLVLATVVVMLLAGVRAGSAALGDCGQPASSGATPLASDALYVLRSAVGSSSCELCVCDVDDSGGITASDALVTLRIAVGQPGSLSCPACAPACEDTGPPSCGGTCPAGLTCAEPPTDVGLCRCVTACELSAAPACGGDCEGSGFPDAACSSLRVSAGGEQFDLCLCLPPEAVLCSGASAPDCGGICPPGAVCEQSGNGCACSRLPVQGMCAQASPPLCGGSCGSGQICLPAGDACACQPFAGGGETCFDAEAPICGGACPDGDLCAVDFFGDCECVEPCEVSAAPSCGGACSDPQDECVAETLTFKGKSVQFCSCL